MNRVLDRNTRAASAVEGFALVWALLFVLVASGMLVSHASFMASSHQELDTRVGARSLAEGFAHSGLIDALSWFRSRPDQPVADFAPRLDPQADPPIRETIDPTLGLVREFHVQGELWGRYEVRSAEAEDISALRGSQEPGTSWDMAARGILYRRRHPDAPFDQKPNRVIAMTSVQNEFRGVPFRPPMFAAVSIERAADVTLRDNSEINGGSAPGVVHRPSLLADLVQLLGGVLFGTPGSLGISGYDDAPATVFSMTLDEVRTLADVVSESAASVPRQPKDGQLIFVGGDMVLQADRRQRGNVLLIIDGDLVALRDNDTEMSGIVYVNGDASLEGPFELRGMLMVRGNLVMGGGVDDVRIVYDKDAVQDAADSASRYRRSRVVRPGYGYPQVR